MTSFHSTRFRHTRDPPQFSQCLSFLSEWRLKRKCRSYVINASSTQTLLIRKLNSSVKRSPYSRHEIGPFVESSNYYHHWLSRGWKNYPSSVRFNLVNRLVSFLILNPKTWRYILNTHHGHRIAVIMNEVSWDSSSLKGVVSDDNKVHG